MRQAREEALQNELSAKASTPQQSSIRDHTGSGVGNNPDDHRQDKPQTKASNKPWHAITTAANPCHSLPP